MILKNSTQDTIWASAPSAAKLRCSKTLQCEPSTGSMDIHFIWRTRWIFSLKWSVWIKTSSSIGPTTRAFWWKIRMLPTRNLTMRITWGFAYGQQNKWQITKWHRSSFSITYTNLETSIFWRLTTCCIKTCTSNLSVLESMVKSISRTFSSILYRALTVWNWGGIIRCPSVRTTDSVSSKQWNTRKTQKLLS